MSQRKPSDRAPQRTRGGVSGPQGEGRCEGKKEGTRAGGGGPTSNPEAPETGRLLVVRGRRFNRRLGGSHWLYGRHGMYACVRRRKSDDTAFRVEGI